MISGNLIFNNLLYENYLTILSSLLQGFTVEWLNIPSQFQPA